MGLQIRSCYFELALCDMVPDKYECCCSSIRTGVLVGGDAVVAFSASCLKRHRLMLDQGAGVAHT
jgi:hypothetical protein